MNSFSFKSFKFFKSSEPQAKKHKNSTPASKKEIKLNFWQKLVQSPLIFLFIFVAALAYFISYLPSKSLPLLPEGEIAPSDITAPEDLTIEDTETTEKRRKEAVEVILPVYTLDLNILSNTEEKIREFFNSGR